MSTTSGPLGTALAVARDHGLPTRSARVLRDTTNLLVHLAPAPIVVRVPLTLARLRDPAWSAQTVELASFLARAGAPVAAPAADVDPGPHERDGLHVSFWAHVEHDGNRFDPEPAGRSLRQVHEALASYAGVLPSCDRLDEVGRLLATLEPSPLVSAEELTGLRAVHSGLARPPGLSLRPLHGDAHFGNVLWSPDGPLWTDFENACSGPIEYDLACLVWRDAPGTDEALSAYGAHDERAIEELTPLLALFLATWTIVVVERVSTDAGRAEARRRIRYALEM